MLDNIPHISRYEFEQKAFCNPDVNFIASVVTPWHALCLDAAIRYMESEGVAMNGMVLIEPHVCSGFNVDERNFLGGNYTLYVSEEKQNAPKVSSQSSTTKPSKIFRFVEKKINHLKRYAYVLFGGINWCKRRDLYVVDYIYPDCHLGRKCSMNDRFARHIILDDGYTSYYPHIWETVPQKSFMRNPSSWMMYFRDVIVEHRWIFAFHHVISGFVFKKKKPLQPNVAIIPYFKQVLIEHSRREGRLKGVDMSRSVVIATGTHLEEIERYQNEDLRVWKSVCDMLHLMGIKVYLKPHPRDTFFRDNVALFNCILLNDIDSMSIEELCIISHPMCILGFPSMAIITPKVFFDIPTVGVFNLIDKGKCNAYAMNIINNFEVLFTDIVAFPSSMDEFTSHIESIFKTK